MKITDGFGNEKASKNDPKAVVYMFDPNGFPNVPLIQPRLNSVEEWTITNFNNDAHPMHIHVNDFQMMKIDDHIGAGRACKRGAWTTSTCPRRSSTTPRGEHPAALTLRQEFLEFAGTYVIHCHRLNHEDNGLMATDRRHPRGVDVRGGCPRRHGKPATVQVRDTNGDKVLQTVVPFPDFEGTPSVAMADVNGDMILDLVVGTGQGVSPEVAAYDGNDTKTASSRPSSRGSRRSTRTSRAG